jgi:hypothetical protein
LEESRSRSNQAKAKIRKLNKQGITPEFEIAVVGMGVHGAEFMTAVESIAPGTSMVGFDKGDGKHPVFDSDFFHLNSSNGPEKDDTPLMYGPNQLRDLMPVVNGHVYPRARGLANGTHNEMGALASDYLLENGIASATQQPDGYFLITGGDGSHIRARKLVAAIGYGPTRRDFLDADSQTFVKQSLDDLHKGNFQGIVVPFDDYRIEVERRRSAEKELAKKEHRSPDDQADHLLVGKSVLLVGGGDGGAVVAEHESPNGSKLYWVGQAGEDGQSYLAAVNNKKRYGDNAERIDEHEIETHLGHVKSIHPVEIDGKRMVETIYADPNGGEVKVVRDVDILSTGYERAPNIFGDMVPHFFANNNDPELSGVWDVAKRREKEYYEKHPEVVGKETPNFYSVGVYGFHATGMPSVAPGTGVTIQIAKELTGDVVHKRALTQVRASDDSVGALSQVEVDRKKAKSKDIESPRIALAGAKTELLRETRNFNFSTDLHLAVKFHPNSISFEIKGVMPKDANALLGKLRRNKSFLGYLSDMKVDSGTLNFQIPKTEDGGLRMDRAQITQQ